MPKDDKPALIIETIEPLPPFEEACRSSDESLASVIRQYMDKDLPEIGGDSRRELQREATAALARLAEKDERKAYEFIASLFDPPDRTH